MAGGSGQKRVCLTPGSLSACRANAVGWRWNPKEFFRTVPADGAEAAPRIKPIFASKLNTLLQFLLVGSCVSRKALGWPDDVVTDALVLGTLSTTVVSGVQYWRLYAAGKLMSKP